MPSFLDIFNWDVEDLIHAGDKVPHSKDDKECGEHFIPIWKDCHDGDAHRPPPGENPYWTDENSAEERRDRDVPWDTNKPKTREEREKETDWPLKEEEPVPEKEEIPEEPPPLTDEDMGPPEEEGEQPPPEFFDPDYEEPPVDRREVQRQATEQKWAQKEAARQLRTTQQSRQLAPETSKAYAKQMKKALNNIASMTMLAFVGNYEYPGSTKETPGERNEEWSSENARIQQWLEYQGPTEDLAGHLREVLSRIDITLGEELKAGRIKNRLGGIFEFPSYELALKKAETLLDRYENDKYATSNPQDILAWEKLKRATELDRMGTPTSTMQSVTEIPGFRFKGIDPANMKPSEEKFVKSKLREMDVWLAMWQRNPASGHGDYLAKKLLGGAEQMGPYIDESPIEPNPEAARIISEISARAGAESASDLMWEEFGISEEWTPSSFLHDYSKAAKKAIVMAKATLGLDIADISQDYKFEEKLRAQAKKLDRKHLNAFRELVRKRLQLQHDHIAGLIGDIPYKRETGIIEDQIGIQTNEAKAIEEQIQAASEAVNSRIDEARGVLHERLTAANIETRAQDETITETLVRLDTPMWRDMGRDTPAKNKKGEVTPKAQKDFDNLQARRNEVRARTAQIEFIHVAEIKATMGRVLGWLHRDLLEGPEGISLREMNWEAEIDFRARANDRENSIVLDAHEDPSIAAHEFGHHLEFRNRRVKERILDFYNARTEGIKEKHLRGYEDWEKFKQPKTKAKQFFHEYASKFYIGLGGQTETTEILSLGLEALENPHKFREIMKKDPEHLAIILATIRGF